MHVIMHVMILGQMTCMFCVAGRGFWPYARHARHHFSSLSEIEINVKFRQPRRLTFGERAIKIA
jgi:hypothetical protein